MGTMKNNKPVWSLASRWHIRIRFEALALGASLFVRGIGIGFEALALDSSCWVGFDAFVLSSKHCEFRLRCWGWIRGSGLNSRHRGGYGVGFEVFALGWGSWGYRMLGCYRHVAFDSTNIPAFDLTRWHWDVCIGFGVLGIDWAVMDMLHCRLLARGEFTEGVRGGWSAKRKACNEFTTYHLNRSFPPSNLSPPPSNLPSSSPPP